MNIPLIEQSRIAMLANATKHLEKTVGTPCKVVRNTASNKLDSQQYDAKDVYGVYAGSSIIDTTTVARVHIETDLLLTAEHFAPFYAGGAELAYADELTLYTSNKEILAGDIIIAARTDGNSVGFEVLREDALGQTTPIITVLIISPIMLPDDSVNL